METNASSSAPPQLLSAAFFYLRSASIAVSCLGLLAGAFSFAVLVKRYRTAREAFDVGLILLEACQVVHSAFCVATFSCDMAAQYTGIYNSKTFLDAYDAIFALCTSALLVRNLWTMCVALFRTLAALWPIAMRRRLTRRVQLLVFGLALAVSLLIGALFFVQRAAQLDQSMLLLFSRALQSYVPVPVVLASSVLMSCHLCRVKRPAVGAAAAAAAAAATVAATAATAGTATSSRRTATAASSRLLGPTSRGLHLHSRLQQHQQNSSRNSRVATAIVLCLAVTFYLFESPGAVAILCDWPGLGSSIDWFYCLNDILVSLDSASNFLIFACLSQSFRSTARTALLGWCSGTGRAGGSGSGVTRFRIDTARRHHQPDVIYIGLTERRQLIVTTGGCSSRGVADSRACLCEV